MLFVAALGADTGREHQAQAGAERREERERDPEAPAGVCCPAGFPDKRHDGRWEAGETNCSEEAGGDGGGAEGGRIINLKQPSTLNLSVRMEPRNLGIWNITIEMYNVTWKFNIYI